VNLDPDKLLVLFVIAMLVLGPKRLPEAARTMGRWLAEVRKYTSGFQNEFRGLLDEPRQQTSALRDEFNSAFAEPRKALEAGAREVQAAANAASAEVAGSPGPGPAASPQPVPVLPQETITASQNVVPDDPALN
jgi:sec-independent protein translocase protein TatB